MSAAGARVGIAMRTCDRPLLLERALRGVLAQSFTDWHIHLYDDGGDRDAVEAAVGSLAAEFGGRISVARPERRAGIGTSMTESVAAGDEAYFVVHDDDDTWEPEFLARTVAALDIAPSDVAGVATRVTRIDEAITDAGVVELERRDHTPGMTFISLTQTLVRNPVPPIALLVRRTAYDAVGGFDAELHQCNDWDLLLRLLLRYRIDVIPDALANYHHRVTANNNAAYTNIVSDEPSMEAARHMLADKAIRRSVAEGRLDYGTLLATVNFIERETLALVLQTGNRVYDLQLAAGEIAGRVEQIQAVADRAEPKLYKLDRLIEVLSRLRPRMRGARNGES